MRFKVVIFDFDGTLADTRKAIVIAKQDTMRAFGLPVLDEETCASTIGLTARAGFQKFYPDASDELLEKLVVSYRARFDELKTQMPPERFPGVDQVLSALKDMGVMRTIATARNKKSLYEFLTDWGLNDAFSYILAGEDTKRLKPYPDAVLKTLEDMSFRAEEALVVGDMPVDIGMGKSAGAFTCGVTYGNGKREDLEKAGADYIIDSIDELLSILTA